MLNISDYLEDLQYPQMLSLAQDYGTEIMVGSLLALTSKHILTMVVVRHRRAQ
jgi:hypothetical protein